MSLPIDIPRRARPSALSSQLSSSSSSSSPASSRSSLLTTPSHSPSSSLGLYIPIHKRTLSADPHYTNGPGPDTHTYTIDALLSLRPNADESIRNKLRASGHPELILSRRIRKNLEFHDRQRVSTPHLNPHRDDNITTTATTPTATAINAGIHRVPTFPLPQKPHHVPSFITQQQQQQHQQRALPRRNTSAGRTSRRHQAWQPISIAASTGTWRGLTLRQSQIV